MAAGNYTDMVIYQAEFQTGQLERITQFLNVFNDFSRGAIRMVPRALRGHYGKEAFFDDIAALVARRDISSTAAVSDIAMTQDEIISVKVNRTVGPVAQALDAIKKAGLTEAQASALFGRMSADHKMRDMVNTAIRAVEAAIQGRATASNLDVTTESVGTLSTDALVRGLALFGDAGERVVCWVSHSKPYYDLTRSQIAANVTNVTDRIMGAGAAPFTLGRPMLVTDSAPLFDANGSLADSYNTLGLVEDAVVIEESEDEAFATEIVTGRAQLLRRWQAEYAYNVKVKGFKWDIANGGINPTDAALGTTTNWDLAVTDNKNTAGIRIVTD